jgi:hypothetical protein
MLAGDHLSAYVARRASKAALVDKDMQMFWIQALP